MRGLIMTREDVLKKLNELFVEAFDRGDLEINLTTTPYDVEGWDSLMQMNLIQMIEGDFEIQFDMDEIIQMESVGLMVDMIMLHIGE